MEAISKEAENALFDEFQNGSERAFTKIVQQFEQLALSQARKRMASSNYKHLQLDLESDVRLILWNAAKKFNPAKGCRFSTYLIRCINNEINQRTKKHNKESKHLEKYCREASIEFVVDSNSDGDYEISVIDPFPFHDEPILPELAPLCKPKAMAILGLICSDEDVWYKNGNLNKASIARKLGISRETVRQIIANLRTNRTLRSTIHELTPR